MEKVRLGVIGTGRLGGFHASKAAANPEVDFIGVTDVCEANRRQVANQWGVHAFATIESLLPNVDAVVVATPSVLHAEIGRQVLLAGKHLLVEKPATTNGATALELASIAESKGLVMQVGHVEQYNPAWRVAQAYLSTVRTGEVPAYINAKRTSGYTFRSTDVGATFDLMIHDLELILSLIPSPVSHISAFGLTQFCGHEDASFATLEFANGSIANLQASRVEMTPIRQTTIRTATQSLFIDFATRSAKLIRPRQTILNGDYSPQRVTFPEMASRVKTFMQEEFETQELVHAPFDALEFEMQDFVSAILRHTPSTVPGFRAAQAVAIAEQIVRDLTARARLSSSSPVRTLKVA